MKIIQAATVEECARARALFEEYAAWLGISLCFQNFAQELEGLPGAYAPPAGRLLLAIDDEAGEAVGCVGLRSIGEQISEMKRLYVKPACKGRGIGRALTTALIAEARLIGYRAIRLDTLPSAMPEAVALYGSLGFAEIEPYYYNPVPGTIFLEKKLA